MWAMVKKTLNLLFKSYLDIFPFVLLYVICIHFIDKLIQPYPLYTQMISILPTMFFFSCILYGMTQRHHDRGINYRDILLIGIKRFLPAVLTFFLMLAPALIIELLFVLISQYAPPIHQGFKELTPNLESVIATALMLALTVAMIVWMVFILYFYVALYLIVVKQMQPLQGLKQSWLLVQGHWFKTFCLLLALILTAAALHTLFFLLIGKFAKEAVSLFITPLSAAVMITYYDHLKQL